jgi:hypothetical protein
VEVRVMKLRLTTATALAVGLSIGSINAQTPQSTGERLTVTGCLQRAQRDGSVGGTVVGTSAAPNTADDEANSGALVNAFLLTDATTSPSGGAAGTTAAASTEPSATGTAGRTERTTFGLQGQEAALEPHQGARVEVTGTVIPPAQSGRGSGGAATAAGAKRLKVESYKVLADKCTAP